MGHRVRGSRTSKRKYCQDGDVEIVPSSQLWTDEKMMRMLVDEERISTRCSINHGGYRGGLTRCERPEGGPACRAEEVSILAKRDNG